MNADIDSRSRKQAGEVRLEFLYFQPLSFRKLRANEMKHPKEA